MKMKQKHINLALDHIDDEIKKLQDYLDDAEDILEKLAVFFIGDAKKAMDEKRYGDVYEMLPTEPSLRGNWLRYYNEVRDEEDAIYKLKLDKNIFISDPKMEEITIADFLQRRDCRISNLDYCQDNCIDNHSIAIYTRHICECYLNAKITIPQKLAEKYQERFDFLSKVALLKSQGMVEE